MPIKMLSLAPLAGPALERLRGLGALELDPWSDHVPVLLHAAADLAARLDGVEVFVVEADHVPAEVIEAATALRVIGVCRGDPVNVDIPAATKREIAVLTTPGRNAEAVAELTVGLTLALTRGILRADADVRAGRWVKDGRIAQQRYLTREIAGMTVGLVGCGAVGRAAARRFLALGARVVGFDPYVDDATLRAEGIEPAPLPDLIAASDVISLHSALGDQTRGMIDAAALARCKPGAYLVNTARYGLVEEAALLGALRDGRLAGAAIDHFPNEFLEPEHPLAAMPNVILTPHLGGTTEQTVLTHTEHVVAGIEALYAGREPASIANPEVLPAFGVPR